MPSFQVFDRHLDRIVTYVKPIKLTLQSTFIILERGDHPELILSYKYSHDSHAVILRGSYVIPRGGYVILRGSYISRGNNVTLRVVSITYY